MTVSKLFGTAKRLMGSIPYRAYLRPLSEEFLYLRQVVQSISMGEQPIRAVVGFGMSLFRR